MWGTSNTFRLDLASGSNCVTSACSQEILDEEDEDAIAKLTAQLDKLLLEQTELAAKVRALNASAAASPWLPRCLLSCLMLVINICNEFNICNYCATSIAIMSLSWSTGFCNRTLTSYEFHGAKQHFEPRHALILTHSLHGYTWCGFLARRERECVGGMLDFDTKNKYSRVRLKKSGERR